MRTHWEQQRLVGRVYFCPSKKKIHELVYGLITYLGTKKKTHWEVWSPALSLALKFKLTKQLKPSKDIQN
jgi:hypothetical protein